MDGRNFDVSRFGPVLPRMILRKHLEIGGIDRIPLLLGLVLKFELFKGVAKEGKLGCGSVKGDFDSFPERFPFPFDLHRN